MSTVNKHNTGVRLAGVDYSSYLKMRAAAGNSGYRMTYRHGVLWIMSPQYRHELAARLIAQVVWAFIEATGLDCWPVGATTFRKGVPGRRLGHGKEGDEAFYLGALAARIRGQETLDLSADPPPSLWIEVDNYGNSKGKLPLYASFGVPEVWQYRVRRRSLKFWRLVDGAYEEISESLALPGLRTEMVLELLDEGRTRVSPDWLKWMREDWLPRNRALFPDFTNQQP
jgi:hypothetical protein